MLKFGFLITTLAILAASSHASAQEVDLLWQGDTYTPPFYEGRSMWSNQSQVTIQAIPNGLGNRASLNYRWTKDGVVLGLVSGVGKSSLTFSDGVFSKPQQIKVEIVGSDDVVRAESSIILSPTLPVLTVYEKNPLYGYMFHKEVDDTYKISGSEISFTAFPLFFTTPNRNSETLRHTWVTNSGEREVLGTVTYRTPEQTSGTSVIQTSLENSGVLMQRVNKTFAVEFDNTNQ